MPTTSHKVFNIDVTVESTEIKKVKSEYKSVSNMSSTMAKKILGSAGMKALQNEFLKASRVLSNDSEITNYLTKDARVVRQSLLGVARAMEQDFTGHITNNPPEIKELTPFARRVREYYLSPRRMQDDILSASKWFMSMRDTEKGIQVPFTDKNGRPTRTKARLFSKRVHKALTKRNILKDESFLNSQRTYKEEYDYRRKHGQEPTLDEIQYQIMTFFGTLRPRPTAGATASGPALLLTGHLRDSISVKVKRETAKGTVVAKRDAAIEERNKELMKKIPESFTGVSNVNSSAAAEINPKFEAEFKTAAKFDKVNKNIFNYSIGLNVNKNIAPYAESMFQGGTINSYWLLISRSSMISEKTSFEFRFPIPFPYVAAFKEFKLKSKNYKVTVETRKSIITGRNPLFFDTRTIQALKNFESRTSWKLNSSIYSVIQKQMNRAL